MQNLFSLEGKVAIVTGALGLLGKEHCYALSEAGANIVAVDIHEEASRKFAETLPGSLGLGVDITKKDSIELLKEKVLTKYGHIDVLVNNAAINDMFENPQQAGEFSKFEKYPLE